jgi:hydrogenase maturation protease
MQKTLILGYGNVDRQDDGVAWHVLAGIARKLGHPVPQEPDEGFELQGGALEFLYALQLVPEMAETLSHFERVYFIDAHTGAKPQDIDLVEIQAAYQASPFTHHMTPETLLALAHSLYGATPQSILASVRGYEFGFQQGLSPATEKLAQAAVTAIVDWINT